MEHTESRNLSVCSIDSELRLLPYYENYDVTYNWYQDAELCRQIDNIDHVYSIEQLSEMYTFLSENGDCYYIEYRGRLVGDVTLRDNNEICIVICREYQNRHIGRRCIREIIEIAREKGLSVIKANIYAFNAQSRKMFMSAGFCEVGDEWFEYRL